MKDAWDGYRANRNRILDHIKDNRIDNTIILSGDSHANWVSDLVRELPNQTLSEKILSLQRREDPNDTSYDPVSGKGSLAVEFAGVSIYDFMISKCIAKYPLSALTRQLVSPNYTVPPEKVD